MAISACGYVAVRALGAGSGLPAAGLASGFVSSRATIAAMGARVVEDSRLLGPAVAGAVLSTIATVVQVAIVVAATSAITLMALGLPLIFAGLAAVAYGLIFGLRLTDTTPISLAKPGEAFSFKAALLLAATLAIVLLGAAALRTWLGERGLFVAAAVAVFADVHATAVSIAAQVAAGKYAAGDACVPILIGFSTNSVTKIILATASGSKAFALRVVPGLIMVLAAAWMGLLVRFV